MSAQSAVSFVKDINTNPLTAPSPSNPDPKRPFSGQDSNQFARLGSWIYFQATTRIQGTELHKSDGKTSVLVMDIATGNASSSPELFTVAGNKVFFTATTVTAGRELWLTDGTQAGTKMVKDIYPGTPDSLITGMAPLGSKVLFSATSGTNSPELWISDGTTAGTQLLKDINPGIPGSNIIYLQDNAAGNLVFFSADDGSAGSELWVSDGTSAGTRLVLDIAKGSAGSSPRHFRTLGPTQVVFQANDGTSGNELWATNGTAASTRLVKDVFAGSGSGTNLSSASSLGSKVLFLGTDGTSGSEPWITDGTPPGTFRLKDIQPGTPSSYMHFSAADAGKGYWSSFAPTGFEIWVTDGSLAGTRRFSKAAVSSSAPTFLAATGGRVFFQGFDVTGGTGFEISMTDGTTTRTVKDIKPGQTSGNAAFITPLAKGQVAFAADDGRTGTELWVSSGTAVTTILIDINSPPTPSQTASDNVTSIAPLFGKLIFSATDGSDKTRNQHGQELWISDGTAAGTRLLKDIYSTSSATNVSSSYPSMLCRLGNHVYFRAFEPVGGGELWRTDGTTAGTVMVKDIVPGSGSSYPSEITRVRDRIYFRATDGNSGYELWVTDGTVQGTRMVKDIDAGPSSSHPTNFAALGQANLCVFSAYQTGAGYELWVTDGTAAGTRMVKDIESGTGSSSPTYMKSWKDKVWFQAFTSATGQELWVTDGTAVGTTLVKDQVPGAASGHARHIEQQGQHLYYSAYNAATGQELHRSDGTAAGTGLYWDLTPGTGSSNPLLLTAVGSRRLWFQATWSSPSIPSGTQPLAIDVVSKTLLSFPANTAGDSWPYNYVNGAFRFAVDGGSVYMRCTPHNANDYQLTRIQNGATAQPIGRIQHSSTMQATDPRIGQNMTIRGNTQITKPVTLIEIGVPDPRPKSLGSFVPGAFAYFQFGNIHQNVGVPTGQNWTSTLPVPNQTSLLGITAVIQAFVLDATTFPANTEATNGVHLTIGK